MMKQQGRLFRPVANAAGELSTTEGKYLPRFWVPRLGIEAAVPVVLVVLPDVRYLPAYPAARAAKFVASCLFYGHVAAYSTIFRLYTLCFHSEGGGIHYKRE